MAIFMWPILITTSQKDNDGSAYDPEDLQSNLQGAIFGEDFSVLEGEDLYKALEGRLNVLGATDPKSAPNYKDLQDDYNSDSGEQVTDYTPAHTTPGYEIPKRLTRDGYEAEKKPKTDKKSESTETEKNLITSLFDYAKN
jgi:hypothetical protein